ncbi:MAG: hypothetical protein LBT69_05275 [Lactobacillales bacterium]|jgi:hypothetical protein|nr:hypothetical protein [Lactobacillales bacterium]
MANQLLNLISTNQNVLKKIITEKTHDAAFKVAQENIPNYKNENFKKDIEELKRIMNGDDNQLNSVTGGRMSSNFQLLNAFSEKHGIDLLEIFERWK